MPDNVVTPYGTFATKDEAGAHNQRMIIRALLSGGAGALQDLVATPAFGLLVDVSRISGNVQIVKPRVALVPAAPAAFSVGVASQVAVAANVNRKGLTLVNTSLAWISLAFNAPAVLYSGISLAPNGGSFTMGEYDFSTLEVRAIASAAASNLAIQEFS